MEMNDPELPQDISHMPVYLQRHWLRLENRRLKEKIKTHREGNPPRNRRKIDRELYAD